MQVTDSQFSEIRRLARLNYFLYVEGYVPAFDGISAWWQHAERFASLLGYSSYEALTNAADEETYEKLKKLAGPHSQALFKVLEARKTSSAGI